MEEHNEISNNKQLPTPQTVIEKSTYTWMLHNVSQLKEYYTIGTCLMSPIFPKRKSKYMWQLLFYPNGEVGNENCVGIFVRLLSPVHNLHVDLQLCVNDSDDEPIVEFNKLKLFKMKDNQCGRFLVLKLNDLKDIENDILKFRAVIKTELVLNISGDEVIYHYPELKLARDLKLALVNKKLETDFSLKIGQFEIQVHRFILAAKSSVFCAMLKYDTIDKTKGYIEITDIDKDILTLLVKFMYEGTLKDLSIAEACKLLYTADKYDLVDLKEVCEDHLIDNLQVSNAVDILLLAESHNSARLKDEAFEYVVENSLKFSDAVRLQKLAQKSPTLLLQLTSKVLKILPHNTEIYE